MRAVAAVLTLGVIAVLGVLFWVGAADPGTARVPPRGDTEDVAPAELQAPPSIEKDPPGTVRAAHPNRTDVTGIPASEDEDPPGEPAAVGPSVLVLDASGNPAAGVPVLAIKKRQMEFLAISIAKAVTGDDGVATFSPWPPSEGPLRALLGFPHFPPIEAAFSTAAEDPPAILRMPPTGSLLVRVLDEQGAPRVGAGPVKIGLAGFVVMGRHEGFEANVDSGAALFPRVGLGLLLDLEVRLAEFDECMARSGVVGPAGPGERVEAVFRGYEQPVITCILVDRSGDALLNAAINVTSHEEEVSRSSTRRRNARTDEKGRLRFLLRENWESGATRWMRLRDGTGSSARYTTVDLSRGLSGVVDLGVLVMTGASLICAGRVVDDFGAPVGGATLSTDMVGTCELVSTETTEVRTDPAGLFQCFGVTDCKQLHVDASKEGYLSSARELVAVGESQVQIVLTRGGSVSGSLGRSEGFPVQRLTLALRRSEDASDRGRRASPKPDGSFQFESLKAGVYNLEVSFARLLCAVEDIVVPAGQDANDPRLQSLALPSTVRLIAIDVVDEQGGPVESTASVNVIEPDGRPGGATALDTVRFAYLTMCREPVTVLATAPGCRSATIEGLVSDQARLTLRPGIPVKLVALGTDAIRDGERMVGFRLHYGSGADFSRYDRLHSLVGGDFTWFDAQREGVMTVSKAGEWRVEWCLRRGMAARFTANAIVDPAPQKIRVEDSGSLQVFQVTPPPGAIGELGGG